MSVRERVPSEDGHGLRVGIVAAQWNERIVRRLLEGALQTLRTQGVADDEIEVYWVPGSFELPFAAEWAFRRKLAASAVHKMDACDVVIALGCVIRGETEHFRLVADAACQGLARVSQAAGRPVLNGVLAVEDLAQAEARSGGEHGNTGAQVALAAIRMVNLVLQRWAE